MKKVVALAAVLMLCVAAPAPAITYGTPAGSSYGNVAGLVGVSPLIGELFVHYSGTLMS